jgi:hypothetical protein
MKKEINKKIKLVTIKGAIYTNCSLHGKQKIVQATKYGSGECKQCLEDIKDFFSQELLQRERKRQYDLLMGCLPEDAENLSTLTDDQAGRLIRCFIKKNPWNN